MENFAILAKPLCLISHPNYLFALTMPDWEFGIAKGSDTVSQERNGHVIHLGRLLNIIIIIIEPLQLYGMSFNLTLMEPVFVIPWPSVLISCYVLKTRETR